MYKRISYKYYNVCRIETGKAAVIPYFEADMLYAHGKPTWTRETKTYTRYYFSGEKYQVEYIIPNTYKGKKD